MLRASDRAYSRRDTGLFLACVALSIIALFLPAWVGSGVAAALRQSVLQPLVWLQERAEEGKTSRERFRMVTAERDSATLRAQSLPALQAENERLRRLLALDVRLTSRHIAAEVLHQAEATDGRMLLLNVGSHDGIAAFNPIVAPEGLLGVVWNVAANTSVAMTWAHPEFRVSAYTADGRVSGMVAPSAAGTASETGLEFRAITYRDTVPNGTLIVSSGLGGVYPRGLPLGTIMGVEREQGGWERVYRVRPAANPAATAHVLVLIGEQAQPVTAAFPSDSLLAAQHADSVRRLIAHDSLARARADSSGKRAAAR